VLFGRRAKCDGTALAKEQLKESCPMRLSTFCLLVSLAPSAAALQAYRGPGDITPDREIEPYAGPADQTPAAPIPGQGLPSTFAFIASNLGHELGARLSDVESLALRLQPLEQGAPGSLQAIEIAWASWWSLHRDEHFAASPWAGGDELWLDQNRALAHPDLPHWRVKAHGLALEALTSEDRRERSAAALALARLADPEAEARIAQLLADPDHELRRRALLALGLCRSAAARSC
jgi:hypothetical protein